MNTNYKSILLAISFLFALSASISAAPGDLDLTFGSGGIVITGDSSQYQFDYALGMAMQPDGKIIVVGEGIRNPPFALNWDFAVVRYNTDGSLDTSFGGTGIVITQFSGNYDGAQSVAIQADGKIVVVGSCFRCVSASAQSSFAIARYHPNGTLDTTFNGTGMVITPVGPSLNDYVSSVAIQADGKIVVGGRSENDSFAIVRYNSNGTLDTTFNGTGKVINTAAGTVSSVAIQSDGKIIAACSARQNGLSAFSLARYHTEGSLDTTFNGTGEVITPVGNSDSGTADLAIQPNGRIVVVGYSKGANFDFAAVRYNPNGSLDTSFGVSGKTIVPISDSYDVASSVAIQSDGKIVAAGTSLNDSGTGSFAAVRFNPNGSLDTTFNGTGKVTTAFPGNTFSSGVAVQADGKIVVAGATDRGGDFYDFVVVRYQGDGAIPAGCPNPIDCSDFFVRQQYLDFLSREPDAGGLAYWTNEVTQCGSDAACIHARRIAVSAAFFIEQEFQETGYYVYRFYKASFGRQPNYSEFTSDRSRISVGINLEASKQAFADEWVLRSAFAAAYPTTMSNTEFVNKVFDFAGLTASRYDPLRQQEILAMNSGRSRALVLRDVIEIPDFRNIPDEDDPRYSELKQTSQYNPAFVLMQYFGYLRRDVDPAGYAFWLDVVNNREPNKYRAMVCAFITSSEYQLRFGSVVTRSNADCGQ